MTYQIQNGVIVNAPVAFSGVITPNSVAGIAGTTTNDNAQAGSIGEYDNTNMNTVAATGTTFTCTGSSAVLSSTAHGLAALQAVTVSTSSALPSGLSAATNYYVLGGASLTANSFEVASTLALAVAGTAISPATAGTGTQTVHGACTFHTSTSVYDICGLALAAGDYDVDAIVFPGEAASVSITNWEIWIAQVGGSSAPTTAANILAQGLAGSQTATASVSTINAAWTTSGTLRISLATPGYLALAGNATFTTGTVSPQALLRARRVR